MCYCQLRWGPHNLGPGESQNSPTQPLLSSSCWNEFTSQGWFNQFCFDENQTMCNICSLPYVVSDVKLLGVISILSCTGLFRRPAHLCCEESALAQWNFSTSTCKKKVLLFHRNILWCFLLERHNISEADIVLLTPPQLVTAFSCFTDNIFSSSTMWWVDFEMTRWENVPTSEAKYPLGLGGKNASSQWTHAEFLTGQSNLWRSCALL